MNDTTEPKLRVSTIEVQQLERLRHAATLLESIRLAALAVRIQAESVHQYNSADIVLSRIKTGKPHPLIVNFEAAEHRLWELLFSIPASPMDGPDGPTEESTSSKSTTTDTTCPSKSLSTPSSSSLSPAEK